MANHLDKTLMALLGQRTSRDTITVVDAASPDNTGNVAHNLGARVLTLQDSQGPYFARQVDAADTRVLMEWEPRSTMRDLASQWKRYGNSTAYLEWVYGDFSPSSFGTVESIAAKLRARLRRSKDGRRATVTETVAGTLVSGAYRRNTNSIVVERAWDLDRPIGEALDAIVSDGSLPQPLTLIRYRITLG
jgi:glycosyltransferase involved in cell wall biosynthesis